MLNLRELESRWMKYKIKSFIPHFIIVISVILIFIILQVIFNLNSTSSSRPFVDNIALKGKTLLPLPKKSEASKKDTIQTVLATTNTPSLKLEPSLNFMKNIQDTTLPYYSNEPQKKTKRVQQVRQKKVYTQAKVTRKVVHQKKSEVHKITIHRKETKDDIKNVIARFKKNNNPALSLFIAKKYYELSNYRQAYNYALITNQINSEIEDSWLIFAKSLVKLKKKEMAMRTLQKYISNTQSNNAQLLLHNIKSGKFR